MSRLRAMAARLRAASVYVQLCLMACRDRLVRLLLLLPVMLLPHTAMANTLFDMIKTVGAPAVRLWLSVRLLAWCSLSADCLASNKSVKNPVQGWPACCQFWSASALPSYRN